MAVTFIILGYCFIFAVIRRDVQKVLKRHRLEYRYSHGYRTMYLRSRKTGRLIGCSNNPFTLILQGEAAA